MTGMSVLRPALNRGFLLLRQNGNISLQKQGNLVGQIAVRKMAGAPQMAVRQTTYEWTRLKNDMHFYVLLGVIPLSLMVMFINLFNAPAEFVDTPEGYEPKEWEYERHPITRFMVKYMLEAPQKQYEKSLHYIRADDEAQYWNRLEKKCQRLVGDRLDHRGWYFVPTRTKFAEYEVSEEHDLVNYDRKHVPTTALPGGLPAKD